MRSPKINQIEGPEDFAQAFPVSRETLERLMTYEGLLKRWQNTINLVAPSTVNHIWHRHFADSAQVWTIAQAAASNPPPPRGEGLGVGGSGSRDLAGSSPSSSPHPRPLPVREEGGDAAPPVLVHWLDLGSGAGFPGLVIAILAAEQGGTRHTLIESDSRKAAFLREVAREVRVAVDILCARIEIPAIRAKVGEVNYVTARALAPLPRLAGLIAPYFGPHTIGIFSKGREVTAEIEETTRSWDFDHELFPSVTEPDARVLLLKSLKPKA